MKRFAVIGVGKFGYFVAKTLYEEGHEVLAVDKDKEKIQAVEPFCAQAVVANGAQKEVLETLQMDQMNSVLVSTGNDMNTSTLATLYLKELKARHIVVKAVNEDHAKILKKIGAHETIVAERELAIKLGRQLSQPNIIDYIPMAEDYNIVELASPKAFVGKTLRELRLRNTYDVNVLAVKEAGSGSFLLVPPADFRIKASDLLIIIGKKANLDRIKELSA